jgi:hypothetical protein
MIGTRYEPSGCARSASDAGSSRASATAVPTLSIVWIGQAEHGGGVGGTVQGDPSGAAAGRGADAELRAPASGALGAEETGAGRRVTPIADRRQIGLGHMPAEAQSLSATPPPAARFLGGIPVVARRSRVTTARIGTAGCGLEDAGVR